MSGARIHTFTVRVSEAELKAVRAYAESVHVPLSTLTRRMLMERATRQVEEDVDLSEEVDAPVERVRGDIDAVVLKTLRTAGERGLTVLQVAEAVHLPMQEAQRRLLYLWARGEVEKVEDRYIAVLVI